MRINEVEQAVGITKKNIRFYEQQGLLKPSRSAENGYRNYTEEDVAILHRIKLLRKLLIPIDEIRKLQENQLSLSDCLERHMIYLSHEEKNLAIIDQMCGRMREQESDLASLNAILYLTEMKQIEKEGMRFLNVEIQDTKKKKAGPWIATIVMMIFMGLLMAIFIWGEMEDPLPIGLFMAILCIPVVVMIGVLAALRQRLKEIEKGEEYEASKY
ncbi:MAG: MerR family transcriptional regulator [Lachnospiraceae bacterium]|nr:MerR family transcriptional regulator [Lachnospiraceae bacterium]